MSVDFASHNSAFLDAFGESFALARLKDLEDSPPTTEAFDAIKMQLDQLGGVPPGDLSNYLKLWINAADFTDLPEKGDEVSTTTTVYKIVDIEQDADMGTLILCRYDREIDG